MLTGMAVAWLGVGTGPDHEAGPNNLPIEVALPRCAAIRPELI